jgi:hypothetical protein
MRWKQYHQHSIHGHEIGYYKIIEFEELSKAITIY